MADYEQQPVESVPVAEEQPTVEETPAAEAAPAETAPVAEATAEAPAESSTPAESEETRKLFVGGLSWNTSDAKFKEFFSKYGEVEDAIIMKDRYTQRSRGFGFITFAKSSSAEAVLKEEGLSLDSRTIECKLAVPRDRLNNSGEQKTKKIFVGGLLTDLSEADFKAYFDKYGAIEEATIMMDRNTGRSRGFGFVTFTTTEAVDKLMGETHMIAEKTVECKRAVPRSQMAPRGRPNYGGPQRGGYGGG